MSEPLCVCTHSEAEHPRMARDGLGKGRCAACACVRFELAEVRLYRDLAQYPIISNRPELVITDLKVGAPSTLHGPETLYNSRPGFIGDRLVPTKSKKKKKRKAT